MQEAWQGGQGADSFLSGSNDITGLPEEQAARTVLAQGKKETARRMILDLVSRTARMGSFDQAERLREWLIDIDPTAWATWSRRRRSSRRKKDVLSTEGISMSGNISTGY